MLKQYSKADQQKLFVTKPIYQRSLVVAAGPFANFLLAIVIFTFIYMFAGKDFTPAKIDVVQENSPAFVAGLQKEDIIFSIDDKEVKSILDVSTYINMSTSDEVDLVVIRNNAELLFSIKPKNITDNDSLGNEIKKKVLGIKIAPL